jgi:integrase
MRVSLTDRFCDRAKAQQAQVDYFDETVSGLALRVTKHGVKAWTLIYTAPNGKRARMTLGRYPMTSLAAARAQALEVKGEIASGRDPRSTTKAETLRATWEEYLKREGPRLRSVDQRRSVFERLVLPVLGDRLMGEIRRSDIVRLLDKIEDNSGPRAAHVTLAYLSTFFNWYASRDDDFQSPVVRGMGRVKPKERARERMLSDDEIRAVWRAASDLETPFARMVRFLLLTATRRNEAANMSRAELADGIWAIPAERMKGKAEHVVPLSSAALRLIPTTGEFIFSKDGTTPFRSFSNGKEEFDRIAPLTKPWTLHDLRRTARSLMSRAGVSNDIAERCLAHAMGGVRGVYDRHAYLEEKRRAFEALAALIERIVNPRENVVEIGRAQ